MVESYAHPGVLVSTDWVAVNGNDANVVVAEVNLDLEVAFAQGHVPGAVGWSLRRDLEHAVRRDIPDMAQFEALMGGSGIGNDTTVVLYGDANNQPATWAFWVMKYYGHADVRLMDGGRAKWLAEMRPLSTEPPQPQPVQYKVALPDRRVRADKGYILNRLGNSSTKILDTRTPEEYSGRMVADPKAPQQGIYRPGRIPGAIHVCWDDATSDTGEFKNAQELFQLYHAAGLTKDDEVIPYCRLGVRSSYSWFVLKYLLGFTTVRNYDGSWTEWGNASGVPIELDPPQSAEIPSVP